METSLSLSLNSEKYKFSLPPTPPPLFADSSLYSKNTRASDSISVHSKADKKTNPIEQS